MADLPMFMVEYSNFTLVWYSKNLSTYVTRHLYVSISCWLSPGQFVIGKSAFLSSISDKFCSLLLYSLQSQFFFLRLSRKEFFTTSWSGFPWGSTRNFGVVGERRRFSTHISGTSMHHRGACRRGFIKIMVTFSSLSLFSALLMKQNRGNVKGYRWDYCCWKASFVLLCGSGFYIIYAGTWWRTLEAKKSMSVKPNAEITCLRTFLHNSHSRLSPKWQDFLSCLIFRTCGKSSAVILISFDSRKNYICLENFAICWFDEPPIFMR